MTGKYQTAVVNGPGLIYISEDFGLSWTNAGSNNSWTGISLSSSGKYQSACVNDGKIFISHTFGKTWEASNSVVAEWESISLSSNGRLQTAVANNGKIYKSIDYGVNWLVDNTFSNQSFKSVAVSMTGQYQTTVVDGGPIYISNDFGETWTTGDTKFWHSVSISASGQYQVASTLNNFVYTSNDFGENWKVSNSTSALWRGVYVSGSGQIITAVVGNGNIYVSEAVIDKTLYSSINILSISKNPILRISGNNGIASILGISELATNTIYVNNYDSNLGILIYSNGGSAYFNSTGNWIYGSTRRININVELEFTTATSSVINFTNSITCGTIISAKTGIKYGSAGSTSNYVIYTSTGNNCFDIAQNNTITLNNLYNYNTPSTLTDIKLKYNVTFYLSVY